MKVSSVQLLIAFIACAYSYGGKTHAQELLLKKVSVDADQREIKWVLSELESSTGVKFVYSNQLLPVERKITLSAKNKTMSDVLDQMFSPDIVSYRIIRNRIILKLEVPAPPESAPKAVDPSPVPVVEEKVERKVTGTVMGEKESLPGVNVTLKASLTGTTTDANGRYSLDVPDEGGVLVFSYVGFISQEISIGNKTVLDISLLPDQKALNEIVVVGYGEQKKASILGAVSTVNGEDIQDVPAANLSNALAGRLAGVTITQEGGKPGMPSNISIRAVGTMSGAAEPLFVIDGTVVDKFAFDGLDVSEVDAVTILKDAASSVVYGARAANGVVLVTTKKGKAGKAQISYGVTVGLETPIKIPATQTGFEQATMINANLASSKIPLTDSRYYTADELAHYKANDYNWIKEAWKNPSMSHHTLNVSGGTDKIKYFFGGALWTGQGSFNNLEYRKYNIRMSVQAEIVKGLVASLNINTNTRNDLKPYWRYDSDSDVMPDLYKAFLFRPSMIPPYIDGKPVGNNVDWHPIEITTDKTGYNKKKFQEYNIIASLEYKVPGVRGLTLKASYNKFTRNVFLKQFSLPYTLYTFKTTGEHNHVLTNEVLSTKIRSDGEFLLERYTNDESYQLNGLITYSRNFGRHSLNAVAVYEQSEGTQDWFSAQRNYFISPSIDQMFGGSSDPKDHAANGNASESGRMSYVGRVSYGYDDRYLFEASFRTDGSQRFAPDKRWGFFPSVSAGWRVSREAFFKNVHAINDLKLRASVGLLGNDAIASWQWYQAFNVANPGAIFGSVTTGILPGAIANPDLTWEKSLTYNAGMDVRFLQRVMLAIDVFKRHTYDIFGSRQLTAPATLGAILPSMNYGIMDSYGIEIEPGYENKIGNNLKYYIRGNFAYAVNKVLRWDEAANQRSYKTIIGHPNDRVWGHVSQGIIRTQADIDALPANYRIFGSVPTLGMLNLKDIRSLTDDTPDNKVDINDDTVLAQHSRPPINYGFSFGSSWKGISVDLVFQGLGGHYAMIDTRNAQIVAQEKAFSFWNDFWTPENPNAAMPRPRNDASSIQASDFWLKNNSFLRCKNLTVAYDLPKVLVKRLSLQKVRFFFIGTNLFLLEDHIKWRDPEAPHLRSYPLMKNFSVGLNINL